MIAMGGVSKYNCDGGLEDEGGLDSQTLIEKPRPNSRDMF